MAQQNNSLLSVLMKAGSTNDVHTLIEAMLAIQTQLSEIKDNQRKIMKAIRDLRLEQRNRLSDIKRSTQTTLKTTHSELVDQLNELQDTVEDSTLDLDNIDLNNIDGIGSIF